MKGRERKKGHMWKIHDQEGFKLLDDTANSQKPKEYDFQNSKENGFLQRILYPIHQKIMRGK